MKQGIAKRKILIVEDNEATRILIKEVLEHLNVTIIESGCVEEALNLFKTYSNEIALVLLDLRLPGCDGCELLKQFRQINSSVPSIAISALSPAELAAKSKAAGFNEYMSKPFDIDEFNRIVSSYL